MRLSLKGDLMPANNGPMGRADADAAGDRRLFLLLLHAKTWNGPSGQPTKGERKKGRKRERERERDNATVRGVAISQFSPQFALHPTPLLFQQFFPHFTSNWTKLFDADDEMPSFFFRIFHSFCFRFRLNSDAWHGNFAIFATARPPSDAVVFFNIFFSTFHIYLYWTKLFYADDEMTSFFSGFSVHFLFSIEFRFRWYRPRHFPFNLTWKRSQDGVINPNGLVATSVSFSGDKNRVIHFGCCLYIIILASHNDTMKCSIKSNRK